MVPEKFYSLLILFLSLEMVSDINKLFEPFTAEINIEKKEYYSNQTISQGLISFQDNKFVYQLNDPMNQTIYGLKDQLIFPELEYDKVNQLLGFNISIVTTAKTKNESLALLRELTLPMQK